MVLESDCKHPMSLGSATLIGQCPSDISVNIKDSAMCLHYNPNDRSVSIRKLVLLDKLVMTMTFVIFMMMKIMMMTKMIMISNKSGIYDDYDNLILKPF